MADTPRSYYDILGISKDASPEDIKKAYRNLARQYHPDVNKDPLAPDMMATINEAYEIIGDPEKRALYDIDEQKGLFANIMSQGFSNRDVWKEIFEYYNEISKKTPAEIEEEYQRLSAEYERRFGKKYTSRDSEARERRSQTGQQGSRQEPPAPNEPEVTIQDVEIPEPIAQSIPVQPESESEGEAQEPPKGMDETAPEVQPEQVPTPQTVPAAATGIPTTTQANTLLQLDPYTRGPIETRHRRVINTPTKQAKDQLLKKAGTPQIDGITSEILADERIGRALEGLNEMFAQAGYEGFYAYTNEQGNVLFRSNGGFIKDTNDPLKAFNNWVQGNNVAKVPAIHPIPTTLNEINDDTKNREEFEKQLKKGYMRQGRLNDLRAEMEAKRITKKVYQKAQDARFELAKIAAEIGPDATLKDIVEKEISDVANQIGFERNLQDNIENSLRRSISDEALRQEIAVDIAASFEQEFYSKFSENISPENPQLLQAQKALYHHLSKSLDASGNMNSGVTSEIRRIILAHTPDNPDPGKAAAEVAKGLMTNLVFSTDYRIVEVNDDATNNGNQVLDVYTLQTSGTRNYARIALAQFGVTITPVGVIQLLKGSPNSINYDQYKSLVDKAPLSDGQKMGQYIKESENAINFINAVANNPLGYLASGNVFGVLTNAPAIAGASALAATVVVDNVPALRKAKEWLIGVQKDVAGEERKFLMEAIYHPQQIFGQQAVNWAVVHSTTAMETFFYLDKHGRIRLSAGPLLWNLADKTLNVFSSGIIKANPNGRFGLYFLKKKRRNERLTVYNFIIHGIVGNAISAGAELIWDTIKTKTRLGALMTRIEENLGVRTYTDGITRAWKYGGGWAAVTDIEGSGYYLRKSFRVLVDAAKGNQALTQILKDYSSHASTSFETIQKIQRAFGSSGIIDLEKVIYSTRELRAQGFIADNFMEFKRFAGTMSSKFPFAQKLLDDFQMFRIQPTEALDTLRKSGFLDDFLRNNNTLRNLAFTDIPFATAFQQRLGSLLHDINSFRNTLFPTEGASIKAAGGFIGGFAVSVVFGLNPLAAVGVGLATGLTHSLGATRGVLTGLIMSSTLSPVIGIPVGLLVGSADVIRNQLYFKGANGVLFERAFSVVDPNGVAHIYSSGKPTFLARLFAEETGFTRGLKIFSRAFDAIPVTGGLISIGLAAFGVTGPILFLPLAVDGVFSAVRTLRSFGVFGYGGGYALFEGLGAFARRIPLIGDTLVVLWASSESGGILGMLRAAIEDLGKTTLVEYLLKHGLNGVALFSYFLGFIGLFGSATIGLPVALGVLAVDQYMIATYGEGMFDMWIKPFFKGVWNWLRSNLNIDNWLGGVAGLGMSIMGALNVVMALIRGDLRGAAISLALLFSGLGITYMSLLSVGPVISAQYTPTDTFTLNPGGVNYVLAPTNGLEKTATVDVAGNELRYRIEVRYGQDAPIDLTMTDVFSNLEQSDVVGINSSQFDIVPGSNPVQITADVDGLEAVGSQTFEFTLRLADASSAFANGPLCNNLTVHATVQGQPANFQSSSVSICATESGQTTDQLYGIQVSCADCACPVPSGTRCTQGPWGQDSHRCFPDLPVDFGYNGPIIAPVSGTIEKWASGRCGLGGSNAYIGDYVILAGSNGIKYSFTHVILERGLNVGSSVSKGQAFAHTGTTADEINVSPCWTGPHTHISITKDLDYVDPYAHFGEICGLARNSCAHNGTPGKKESC